MAVNSTQRNRNQRATAQRLLAIGLSVLVVGVVIMLLADGLGFGWGVVVAVFGGLPTVAGLALLGASFVEGRERDGKPFA